MASVVVGTAGHIDHGKTTLLRELSGIDADRLPEERQRGMTIDVGYAHLALPDGDVIDFVDVPGHDRLVGNMLVGAGEIDAALLVVAADDGPRAQTHEHVGLLDALGIADAVVAVTKADVVDDVRLAEAIEATRRSIDGTTLAGSPIVVVSGATGQGIEDLRAAIAALRARVRTRALTRPPGPLRLAIDRSFAAKGRGVVVTGSLRGGRLATSTRPLRIEPGAAPVRVRELQVRGVPAGAHDGGRTALNISGVDGAGAGRGRVLTTGPGIETSDRLLVVLRRPVGAGAREGSEAWPPRERESLRLHIGTDQVDAKMGAVRGATSSVRSDEAGAILRLDRPVATFVGDRGVLRRPSPGALVAGLRVIDPHPPRGISRRRLTSERVAALTAAVDGADAPGAADALVAIHGAVAAARVEALGAALRAGRGIGSASSSAEAGGVALDGSAATEGAASSGGGGSSIVLAPDVVESLASVVRALVTEHHASRPLSAGLPLAELRRGLALELRRRVTVERAISAAAAAAVDRVVDDLVARGRLAREGDRVRDPAREAGLPPTLLVAMDRLEATLDVAAPPALSAAAVEAGCPPDGIRALEKAGRIVRLEPDLAWATSAYQRLAARALVMARRGDLTPAAFRDATGTSRRYVLAILEDLDRRGILARTPTGHVPGPRAPGAGGPERSMERHG